MNEPSFEQENDDRALLERQIKAMIDNPDFANIIGAIRKGLISPDQILEILNKKNNNN